MEMKLEVEVDANEEEIIAHVGTVSQTGASFVVLMIYDPYGTLVGRSQDTFVSNENKDHAHPGVRGYFDPGRYTAKVTYKDCVVTQEFTIS